MSANKEARARIKINKLLEESGWRFFDAPEGKANILLENNVKITQKFLDEQGNDFEKTKRGYIDFLLLDSRSKPAIVLEAKSEDLHPLDAKEQARDYSKGIGARFVVLSNGNLHYFWDLERGNPEPIVKFPTPDSIERYDHTLIKPDPQTLVKEQVGLDYIALTQMPDYASHPQYQNEATRDEFNDKNRLPFLRKYQLKAINRIQEEVSEGKNRFLFEMATGTGKTLVAAAIIKLFLRTANANRVLFLVDRLELEDQAAKNFKEYLKNDYRTVVYKENRSDWQTADIVVTTVQSLLSNNKYKTLFSPTDFDLVISDEAHRSIGGNSRAVFEYFIGYKLGLTATPKDYLKKFDQASAKDPREMERRMMMDTYTTFGCSSGVPTFRYTLIDGVRDGFLINPRVVDARTEITTQLLSDEGYAVFTTESEDEEEAEETVFTGRQFEKKFFSEETNIIFCDTLLKNGLRDPISGEFGKTIVFAVSQPHARKLTEILNRLADKAFPNRYNSDFAVQVTSRIPNSQQMTIQFSDRNNNLNGFSKWLEEYYTAKTRICITVGMMTTGYDCTDILNLALMRPIFSPTDFIQIKGRGTRKHNFKWKHRNELNEVEQTSEKKEKFKLFDFFANCEYFEEDFDYDEVLKLPKPTKKKATEPYEGGDIGGTMVRDGDDNYESTIDDPLKSLSEKDVPVEGMKIDRMFFSDFKEEVNHDANIQSSMEQGDREAAKAILLEKYMNKPEHFYTLEKLRKSLQIDRRITYDEILDYIFFGIPIKKRDELVEDEFSKFVSIHKPENGDIRDLKYFFMAYLMDEEVRKIIDSEDFTQLYSNPSFTADDYARVDEAMRKVVPEYISQYVNLKQF